MESTSVLKDAAGNSKGVAYVHFEKPEDAEAAITGMNGRTVGIYSQHANHALLMHHLWIGDTHSQTFKGSPRWSCLYCHCGS